MPFAEIVDECDAIFFGNDFVRNFAVDDADELFEPFEHPHFRIVPFENAFRCEKVGKDLNELIFQAIGGLAECLHHEIFAVAIDDERGQVVGFTIDEPEGFGILDNNFSIVSSVTNSAGKEGAINGNVLAREQTNRDLGFIAVESAALEAAAFVGETNHSSGIRLCASHVAAIHPQMACAQTLDSARTDDDRTFRHKSLPSEFPPNQIIAGFATMIPQVRE